MTNKHGFVLVGGLFLLLLASAFIMAAANPESGLHIERRMWYSIFGTLGAFVGGFASGTAIAYAERGRPGRYARDRTSYRFQYRGGTAMGNNDFFAFELLKVYALGETICIKFIAVGPPRASSVHRGTVQFMKEIIWPGYDKKVAAEVLDASLLIIVNEVRMHMAHYYGFPVYRELMKENKPYEQYFRVRKPDDGSGNTLELAGA